MTFELEWSKTVIGGETLSYDFCATYRGILVGRIRREAAGPQSNQWEYGFILGADVRFHDAGMTGHVEGKQEAADRIKYWMQRYLDTEPAQGGGKGLPPEEMPPDQRSGQLRYLKNSDPEAYQDLITQLRTGSIKR